MDSNNTPYFLLREPEEFANRSSRVVWNQQKKALVIAQNQELRLPASDSAFALDQWENATPLALDESFQQARISSPSGDIIEYDSGREFRPLEDGDQNVLQAPFGSFTDIGIGGDGRLAAAFSDDEEQHGVIVFQLAKRWRTSVELLEKPIRVTVDQKNKIWCVTESSLICCEGEPLPHDYVADKTRFEPVTENPHPLQIVWEINLEATDNPLAICVDKEKLYLLIHTEGTDNQIIKVCSAELTDTALRPYPVSEECPFAIDLGCLPCGLLAMLVPRESDDTRFIRRDCAIVRLEWDQQLMSGEASLVRERYPMLSQATARFVSSLDGKLRYQAFDEEENGELPEEETPAITPRELHPLRRPHYYLATYGTLTEVLDSGQVNTTWHRVYLEGCIPAGTRIVLYAKAYNSVSEHASTTFIRQSEWHWCHHRSDIPFGKGLVEPVPGKQGLFELLLQRDKGPVRRLNGRYLKFRIRLESDGRHTPSIHACKVYYPRFSYQEQYFPEHFRQEMEVDPAQDDLAANGADVRERMLSVFEAVWTPLEGQVSSSEVLLSPQHTPEQHLPWLAELLGQSIPDHWPVARTRRWLAATGVLQRWRGTLAGLNLVLDIVTDGAVASGEVVLVENFRLRRTMATILGIHMDDDDHPLTLGTGMSGNSIVGDSLILAEEDAREFLALFAPELANRREKRTVDAFFEKYAHQVSVVLHGRAKRLRNVVSETLEQQMPAHLEWKILETDHPFILGLSPLLAVDTYLEKRPAPRKVKLDDTRLGKEGVLTNASAFSPRDINA